MKLHPLPRRTLLSAQTADVIEAGIRGRRWSAELPGQHELCRHLLVSRKTLRSALRVLAERGLIVLRQGSATKIRPRQGRSIPAARTERVMLLLPEPLWRLRPAVARWVGELRPQLSRNGLELVLVEGGRHYVGNPTSALRRLVSTHPHAVWVLFGGTLGMQLWFAANKLPAILLGSAFPGVKLPSIEYDHAAIARHAAGRFAAAGHERTAILLRRTGSAADATTCAAFAAGRRAGSPPPLVLEHDGGLREIERQLHRFAALLHRPTALFVTKTLAVPAVYTVLSRLGLMIPRDLSVICREGDAFLEYLSPSVARYDTDPAALARKLLSALTGRTTTGGFRISHERLMPRYIPGDSVGAPANRE